MIRSIGHGIKRSSGKTKSRVEGEGGEEEEVLLPIIRERLVVSIIIYCHEKISLARFIPKW